MIIVTGTKRSGTSLWMHLLVAAGLPYIGDRFPAGWGELLQAANPDGFFESELMAGVYYRTNPHPQTGAYLAPHATRHHAVKVFIPGLIRTDVAFIDRCVATVRSWREHAASSRRVRSLHDGAGLARAEGGVLSPALEWWCSNYGLVRDLAIRGYPVHVVSYDALLRDPARVATEVLEWLGQGDAKQAAGVVRPELRTGHLHGGATDAELSDGIDPRHLELFDELYAHIDGEQPLTDRFVAALNRTDEALRPLVVEHQASVDARTIADILGRE
jgi:hypothetical protein